MKRVLLFVSVFLTLLVSPVTRAQAVPLTDEYIASIKAGCTDALQGLLRVERTEAATRVNRGREYESMIGLISAFNSRVVLNRQEAPALTSTAAKIRTKVDDFKQSYLVYADRVDTTLDINCRQAPVTFYDSLTSTREARQKVASDVREIETLLDEYQRHVDELRQVLIEEAA